MKKRLHVFFSGTVQGVGFRYTTERIAKRHPVTGFVKNLPNGKVEVLAEGEEAAIKKFLDDIQEAFHVYIRDAHRNWDETTGEYHDFTIKF